VIESGAKNFGSTTEKADLGDDKEGAVYQCWRGRFRSTDRGAAQFGRVCANQRLVVATTLNSRALELKDASGKR